MKLAALAAVVAFAISPAAFAQNTMSSGKMPAKHDTAMKSSDAKEDMAEKKMATHHRTMHHKRHRKMHHHMMHHPMMKKSHDDDSANSEMKNDSSMTPKK